MKRNTLRQNSSGQGLVIVVILILLIGGGLWYLASHKQAMEKEGRGFGRDAINRIVLNYDINFLGSNLSPQAKLDLPPSEQNALMNSLRQLGQPAQPFQVDESMSWEGAWVFKFFEPHGIFTAHLNYPAGPATLQIAIDHPVGKWEIVNLSFNPPPTAR